MKRLTLLFVMFASVAFGQSDTTDLNTLINANFPNNTSNFITPTRLRTVAKELMRSSANLLEPNTFAERQTFEDAVIGEDSIKSDVGFYVWNGVAYEEIGGGGDTANWAISGGFISPVNFTNKLNVDTARFAGNLYPDGSGVNIGMAGAKFDTVFANVVEGIEPSKWSFGSGMLSPSVNPNVFRVTVISGDTITGFLLARRNGRLRVSIAALTPNDTSVISIMPEEVSINNRLSVNDTLFASVIDRSYGEMGFRDSSYTVALTIDVPAWATNAGNNLWAQSAVTMKSVTYDGDSLVIGRSGVYYLSGHISVAGSNSDVLRAYIYKNGSPLCLCSPVISLTTNRIVNLQLNTDIAPLASGDVLKVYIENIGTNNDVAAISGKLTVHRIN